MCDCRLSYMCIFISRLSCFTKIPHYAIYPSFRNSFPQFQFHKLLSAFHKWYNWSVRSWRYQLLNYSLSDRQSDINTILLQITNTPKGWCYFPSERDGNKWPQNAIFHLAQMVPPIECDLGYRLRTRILNPNPNPNSNKNLCSAKRHPNKVQNSVINISYFVGQGVGV